MRKTLSLLAVVAASVFAGVAHADVYIDGGLRNITGMGHQATGAIGADTALGRSDFRAGAELSHSFGATAYSSVAGVVSYDAGNFAPYAKLGKLNGAVAGAYKGIGVEYRTPQAGGWSIGAEYGSVTEAATPGRRSGNGPGGCYASPAGRIGRSDACSKTG